MVTDTCGRISGLEYQLLVGACFSQIPKDVPAVTTGHIGPGRGKRTCCWDIQMAAHGTQLWESGSRGLRWGDVLCGVFSGS